MDCVEDCGYDNLSLSKGFLSEKHSSQYVNNVGIYSVGRDLVYQIEQIGKTKCFAGVLREGLTCETLAKTNCHHLS